MAGTKEDAKLEIKEIIAKIRRGESPSTSRAYELMDQFQLGGLAVEMAKAMEEAAAKSQVNAQGNNKEAKIDPIKASEDFFKDPEVKEILDTHKIIDEGKFDTKKHTNKLIKTSNKAIKLDELNKKQIKALEEKRNSLMAQVSEGIMEFKEFTSELIKITDSLIKHKQILGHSEEVQKQQKAHGLKNPEELFSDSSRTFIVADEIKRNNKNISDQEINHAQSMLESLRKPEQTQAQQAAKNRSAPRNLESFKASTPVQYINSGKALTPDSTPGAKTRSQGKAT